MQRTDYMYVLPRAQMVVARLVRVQTAVVLLAVPVVMAGRVRALVLALTVERAGWVADIPVAQAPMDLMVVPVGLAQV